jgi:hypothetical protein
MTEKICKKCNITKPITQFNINKQIKDGFTNYCKICIATLNQQYYDKNKKKIIKHNAQYAKNNIDSIRQYKRQWNSNNQERLQELKKVWYKNNPDIIDKYKEKNKEKIQEYKKQYAKDNKEKLQQYHKEYCKTYTKIKRSKDITFKIKTNLRSRINNAIKTQSSNKAYKTIELLGCTGKEAKVYLESLFQTGMSWDNYGFGNDKWNIDHIIPIASFDLTDPEEQKKCFHYTNLQPLWQPDNLKKGNKII